MSRTAALEEGLGHSFANPELLEQALTHSSFGPRNNERHEFLGDGVLGCAIAHELFRRFPELPEGKLTQLRSRLVREESLADVANHLQLAQHLRLGASDLRTSILADALEAIYGAVFLDAGYQAAHNTIVRTFGVALDRLDPTSVAKDAKTQLQEKMHARKGSLPEYRVVATHGAAHQRSFEVECVIADLGLTSTGAGSSLQRAEQEAARAVLDRLEGA